MLARTHCFSCGAREFWRYSASLFRIAVPESTLPGGTFRLRIPIPSVETISRTEFSPHPTASRAEGAGEEEEEEEATDTDTDDEDDDDDEGDGGGDAQAGEPPVSVKEVPEEAKEDELHEIFGKIHSYFRVREVPGRGIPFQTDLWRVPPDKHGGDEMEGTFYRGAGLCPRHRDRHHRTKAPVPWAAQVLPPLRPHPLEAEAQPKKTRQRPRPATAATASGF